MYYKFYWSSETFGFIRGTLGIVRFMTTLAPISIAFSLNIWWTRKRRISVDAVLMLHDTAMIDLLCTIRRIFWQHKAWCDPWPLWRCWRVLRIRSTSLWGPGRWNNRPRGWSDLPGGPAPLCNPGRSRLRPALEKTRRGRYDSQKGVENLETIHSSYNFWKGQFLADKIHSLSKTDDRIQYDSVKIWTSILKKGSTEFWNLSKKCKIHCSQIKNWLNKTQ